MMRAVTLRHPWAYAVKLLGKDVENRTWSPNGRLKIGERFAIHAGKPPRANSRSASDADYWHEIAEALAWMESVGIAVPRPFTPRMLYDAGASAIVAVATFAGSVRSSSSLWFVGPCGWAMRDVVALEQPVPCRGAQGLWTMPPDVEAAVIRRIGDAA